MKPLTPILAPAIVSVGIALGAAVPAPGGGQTTTDAAIQHPAPSQGGQDTTPSTADLVCKVFVEQDDFSSPLNKNGTTTSPNDIKGATVGCSSPNGRFALGNRDHNPVLRASSYTSVGGPSVNNVTELNHDCTTITQNAMLKFTWTPAM